MSGKRFGNGKIGSPNQHVESKYVAPKASPEQQGKEAAREIRDKGDSKSLGTFDIDKQVLTSFSRFIGEEKNLSDATKADAMAFQEERAKVGIVQTTLDKDRCSLQRFLGEKLPIIKLETEKGRLGTDYRHYNSDQITLIAEHQRENNAFATELAAASGLRAHELLTLRLATERPADSRLHQDKDWKNERFEGREGIRYTVVGKGGLCREVNVPARLAERLEERRLETPVTVQDRGINYTNYYNTSGGQSWSQSFGDSSRNTLGWSDGAHALRHTYAEARMAELGNRGYEWKDRLTIVSQELGHFRPDITITYLR